VKDTIEELKEQERELAMQRLDNITDYYEYQQDRADGIIDNTDARITLMGKTGKEVTANDYAAGLNATANKLGILAKQREVFAKEFEALIASGVIEEDSADWHKYTEALEELDSTILQTEGDLQDMKDAVNDIALTNLQNALDLLAASADAVKGILSLNQAQGAEPSAEKYASLITNGDEQIANIMRQNEALRAQQETLDTQSEKYQELQRKIEGNEQAILDVKTSQEEWNDAIADTKIKALQEQRDELERVNDAYERQKRLQEALEDLQKAQGQRNKLVYRDGIGFAYESDQKAVRDAQEALNDARHDETLAKLDDAIKAIEDLKKTDNIYNEDGTIKVKAYAGGGVNTHTGLAQLDGTASEPEVIFNESHAKKLWNLVQSGLRSPVDANHMYQAARANVLETAGMTMPIAPITLTIGDVVVSGVQDTEGLSAAIVRELPNQLMQRLYKQP